MKYVIDLLQKQWNANADKAEYMICGTPDLEAILDQNNQITDAIKILNEGIRESEKRICETCHYAYPNPMKWPCSDCKRHNKWKSKSDMERT